MTLTIDRPIVPRRQAVAQGLQQYFTGKPCKHGHIDMRFTADRKCAACNRMRMAEHRNKYPDRVKQRNAEHYAANKERRKAVQRAWNARNAEYAAAYADEYRQANPEVRQLWRQRNRRREVLYVARRRAAKLQRTPAWAELAAMEEFYVDCPPGYEVDHIIPLRGDLVSGLHVLNNLQYLPRSANAKKSNKFDPWTFIP